MAEYKRPLNEVEFQQNFAQKKPLMSDSEAYYESSRCLFCYDAPCVTACPTGIDIPLFIKQIQTKNTVGAAKTIYDSNWMGNACGTICPTGVLCEGACVHQHQDVPVIQIGRLQNYATRQVIDKAKQLYKAGQSNGKKIAVVGAGPAGIACACELRMMGYEVDIFEAKEKPSGLTVYGIAPYKITNEEVIAEIAYLQNQLNFTIHYNAPILSKQDMTNLESTYDAIFLGVGLGSTAQLQLNGEELSGVVGAVEFIEELRMEHHKTEVGNHVVIIGGGNTAMDAASEAARMGASSVTLAYRRGKERMSAYDFEYKLAIGSGVQSLFHAQPIEILGEDKVTGVKFSKTISKNGKLEFEEGSEFIVPCDMVIKATGQGKQVSVFNLIDGLTWDEKKRVVVNTKTYQTTNPKYFAGGDAVNGGAEVVNAAFEGKMAARGMDQWLN
jgi:glutamate synthase (NADPH/NADH) small chain